MRVIYLASGAFALPTLRWLHDSEHEIALVVTQPARPSGRGKRRTRTPVRAVAEELGLAAIEPEDVNDENVVARLAETGAHLGVVVAFGQKLGQRARAALPGGFVNLHASLLPKYRGAAPINWAIVNGEEKTGVTVFRIVERMDAGPVLISRWTYIKAQETAGELHDRLAGVGVDAIEATLQMFEGGAIPHETPQDEAAATRAPKLSKELGRIDFARPAEQVANHICGMTPWPGATARFEAHDGRWEGVTIARARPAEISAMTAQEPGELDERLYVTTGDGLLELLEIKPSSGRLMTWQDYVNGRRVTAGDRLVTPR